MFTYCDAEDLVRAWLLTTSVASLVNNKIFLAMPTGVPLPSIVLSRVGGAPTTGSDVPEDSARISFSCWAKDRPTTKTITRALVGEVENLSRTPGFVNDKGRLQVAETLSWLWQPDPVADMPRYIVDVLVVTTCL